MTAPRALAALAALLLATGCSAIAPTAVNKSDKAFVGPDADGIVLVTVPIGDHEKASFSMSNPPDGVDVDLKDDDSPDGAAEDDPCFAAPADTFCTSFNGSEFPANIYLVDVFFDDADTADATIAVLAGSGAAPEEGEGDTDATDTEDTDATDTEDADATGTEEEEG